MSPHFKTKFSSLPLGGQVKDPWKYWSSDYWPLQQGGINKRWNTPEQLGFNLNSPGLEQLKNMDLGELKTLAPSEKFDLLNGDYSYPLKNKVAQRTSPQRAIWEGICHGWAAATLNHAEPFPKLLTNPDGIKIPFGASDIKAILSYYYAYTYSPVSTHQMGRRCNGREFCQDDLNAGAFHIVLTNKVGLEGGSFILDIDNGREVWNHVAHTYRSTVIQANLSPSSDSAPGTQSIIRLKTELDVVFNIVRNSWAPVIGTKWQTLRTEVYEYDLDLNSSGMIIGGDWKSVSRPDFLWLVSATTEFGPDFAQLEKLLND